MKTTKDYINLLDKVKSLHRLERAIEVVGIIFDFYQQKCNEKLNYTDDYFVVVGGLSLEFWTDSDYMTKDIDIIITENQIMNEVLGLLKFVKVDARHWYHEELDLAIEFPTGPYAGNYESVKNFETELGFTFRVNSVEEIFIDRVRSILYFNTDDVPWLIQLAINFELDVDYLVNACETSKEKEFIADFFYKLQNMQQEALQSKTNTYPELYISISPDDSSIDSQKYEHSDYYPIPLSNATISIPYNIHDEDKKVKLVGSLMDDEFEFQTTAKNYFESTDSDTGFYRENIYAINHNLVTIEDFERYLGMFS